jgi:hypothetical protein
MFISGKRAQENENIKKNYVVFLNSAFFSPFIFNAHKINQQTNRSLINKTVRCCVVQEMKEKKNFFKKYKIKKKQKIEDSSNCLCCVRETI